MPLPSRTCLLTVGVGAFLGLRAYSVHAERAAHVRAELRAAESSLPWTAAETVLASPDSTVDELPESCGPPTTKVDFRHFRPSKNGFRFRNSFTGSPMPQGLEAIGSLLGAPTNFGLCGGMSSAAADLFSRGELPPESAIVPVRGEALYQRLWTRQVDSFGGDFGMVATFASWMNKRDEGLLGTQHLSAFTLGPIRRALDAGEPVVVGMVLRGNGRGEHLWDNHQVLAYGAAGERAGIRLRIYDPNHPRNDTVAIVCTPRVVGSTVALGPLAVRIPILGYSGELQAEPTTERPRATRTPVRGVFAMPYASPKP